MKPYGYFFLGFAAVCGIAASIASDRVPPNALPNRTLTPGAARTTDANEVCRDVHTGQWRHWSRDRDDRILRKYGLPTGPHPDYELTTWYHSRWRVQIPTKICRRAESEDCAVEILGGSQG